MRSPRPCPRRWAPTPPLSEDMQMAHASASPDDSGATGDGACWGRPPEQIGAPEEATCSLSLQAQVNTAY